jgi:hypothetical protein
LNAAFFIALHACLVDGGKLIILTDDEGVCKSSCKELATLPDFFASTFDTPFVHKVQYFSMA